MSDSLGAEIDQVGLPTEGGLVDVSNYQAPAGSMQDVNIESWKGLYTPHQEQNVNVFLDDCYTGDGGFRGNVEATDAYSYIVPKPTENFYKTRVKLAEYFNIFAPYIRAKSDPVFAGGVDDYVLLGDDKYAEEDVFLDFSDDCTGTGKSLNELRREAAIRAHIHDVSFIIIDRVDTLDGGKKTIAYSKSATDVDAYEIDPRNKQLTSITFWEGTETDGKGNYIFVKHRWDAGLLTVYKSNPTSINRRDQAQFVSAGEQFTTGISELNVYPMFHNTGDMGDYKPKMPESYTVGRLCVKFYDMMNLLIYLIFKQGHGMLVFQGEMNGILDPLSNVTIVPPNVAGGNSYSMPEILSVDPDIIRVQYENLEKMWQWIVTIMGDGGVTVTQGQAQSGVSKAYDYISTANEAKKTVDMLQRADKWIYRMFNLFEGRQSAPEYVTKYPSDFFPQRDIDVVEYMEHATSLLSLGLKENAIEVVKAAQAKILGDKSAADMTYLLDEVQRVLEAAENADYNTDNASDNMSNPNEVEDGAE